MSKKETDENKDDEAESIQGTKQLLTVRYRQKQKKTVFRKQVIMAEHVTIVVRREHKSRFKDSMQLSRIVKSQPGYVSQIE